MPRRNVAQWETRYSQEDFRNYENQRWLWLLRNRLYPIGGSFHRAPSEGLEVKEIIRSFARCHGCNIEVRLANGKRAAVDSANIEPDNLSPDAETGAEIAGRL